LEKSWKRIGAGFWLGFSFVAEWLKQGWGRDVSRSQNSRVDVSFTDRLLREEREGRH
jgi:hypothetical protein